MRFQFQLEGKHILGSLNALR